MPSLDCARSHLTLTFHTQGTTLGGSWSIRELREQKVRTETGPEVRQPVPRAPLWAEGQMDSHSDCGAKGGGGPEMPRRHLTCSAKPHTSQPSAPPLPSLPWEGSLLGRVWAALTSLGTGPLTRIPTNESAAPPTSPAPNQAPADLGCAWGRTCYPAGPQSGLGTSVTLEGLPVPWSPAV